MSGLAADALMKNAREALKNGSKARGNAILACRNAREARGNGTAARRNAREVCGNGTAASGNDREAHGNGRSAADEPFPQPFRHFPILPGLIRHTKMKSVIQQDKTKK